MPRRTVKTVIPADSVFRIRARARSQGQGGLTVTVPAAVVRGLTHLGWGRSWLRVRLGEHTWVGRAHRHSGTVGMDLTIPAPYRGAIRVGDVVDLELEDPKRSRCAADAPLTEEGLDWAALVPADCFATADGDELVIHNRTGTPFCLRRVAPPESLWLIDFYAAHGSLSVGAHDWAITKRGWGARVVQGLEEWGIGRGRVVVNSDAVRVRCGRVLLAMTKRAIAAIEEAA